MSIPVIPESAPFTTSQRAWLNGFFAGLLSTNNGSATGAIQANGSSVVEGNVPPAVEEDFPWHDSTLPISERLQLAEGRPVERQMMAAMAQLNCGACGYLCQTYSEAIAKGEEKDLTRCTPGGSDTVKALKQISAAAKANPTKTNGTSHNGVNGHANGKAANGKAGASPAGGESTAYTRNNPYPAKLLQSIRLTHAEAPKDTRHVEIDLKDSGLTYEAGDSLGILPVNESQLVDELLQALGMTGTESIASSSKTLRDFLLTEVTLSRTRGPVVELLAASATNPAEATELKNIIEQETHPLATADVVELLVRFPSARPPLEELLAALPKLQPRLYSISSSLKAHPGEVHLTVGVVRFESLGRWRNGVASHFLGVRSLPGDEIRVFIQPSKFRLPENPATPTIMVGPGTGIAPFRAFLEERQATKAPGKNWLFFGNQYFEYDFLYRNELDAFQESKVLTRLDIAFSRDRAQKVYVQDRMREHGAELWQWLQEGAHFYVCGDAKRMAQDVDQTLQQIAAQHGNLSAAEAKAYVAGLLKAKRYQKDVY